MNDAAIWKYEIKSISSEDIFEIEIPEVHKLLTVQVQRNIPCLWALVNPKSKTIKKKFSIVGTGNLKECGYYKFSGFNYISTMQMYDGNLVFHIFEVIE